jgi:hypothetical protein
MSVPSLQVFQDGPVAVDSDNLNTFVQTAQMASQLRSVSGVTGMEVLLQGITTPNDGFGGTFYWSATATAPDDNLNVLVPNGTVPGAWLRTSPLVTSLRGTTTNDNAAPGLVGEYISTTTPIGSAVPLLTTVPANVANISLSAGDWDVSGNVGFIADTTTTVAEIIAGISTTSGVLPTMPGAGAYSLLQATLTTGKRQALQAGQTRISIATTTTVFLVAQGQFAVSTLTACGFIGARRAR